MKEALSKCRKSVGPDICGRRDPSDRNRFLMERTVRLEAKLFRGGFSASLVAYACAWYAGNTAG
jgi:hypothetical protein